MRNNRETTRRDLSKSLVISSSDIQWYIKFLKETGIIIRLGSDRKGLWRVLKQYPDGKNDYYDFHDTNAIISGRETTSVSKWETSRPTCSLTRSDYLFCAENDVVDYPTNKDSYKNHYEVT